MCQFPLFTRQEAAVYEMKVWLKANESHRQKPQKGINFTFQVKRRIKKRK